MQMKSAVTRCRSTRVAALFLKCMLAVALGTAPSCKKSRRSDEVLEASASTQRDGAVAAVDGGPSAAAEDASSLALPPDASSDAAAAPGAVLEPGQGCTQPTPKAECKDGYCAIEPGCFVIGAPRSEFGAGRYSDRQAQVTLTRRFALGRTEVTRGQWAAAGMPAVKRMSLAGTADCSAPDCPLSNVNFYEAIAFANKLSESQGLAACYALGGCTGELGVDYRCHEVSALPKDLYACTGYRLPTEAEWEYAARAGQASPFYSGDIVTRPDFDCSSEPNLEAIAWYCSNADGRAHPVGQKRENAWGLQDMLGNVFEWCSDNFEGEGYGSGPLVDPVVLKKPGTTTEPTDEVMRVARGGNHVSAPVSAKVNKRFPITAFTSDSGLGFRLARSLATDPPK
jgi:sulfatase modifying factor 1